MTRENIIADIFYVSIQRLVNEFKKIFLNFLNASCGAGLDLCQETALRWKQRFRRKWEETWFVFLVPYILFELQVKTK